MAKRGPKSGRPVPMARKGGVTMSGRRTLEKGGKIYKCGGKIKK